MSQAYVNGPAEIYVGQGSSTGMNALFLGWGEDGVRITLNSAWENVVSDVSGTGIPFDVQYMAEEAFIHTVLTVWNESVYEIAAGRVDGNVFGAGASLTCGTLMGAQSCTIGGSPTAPIVGTQGSRSGGASRLCIKAPYQSMSAFASMPAAYNFPVAWLDTATDLELATRYKKIRCVWRAIPQWNQANYGWVLYNASVTGLPGTN